MEGQDVLQLSWLVDETPIFLILGTGSSLYALFSFYCIAL